MRCGQCLRRNSRRNGPQGDSVDGGQIMQGKGVVLIKLLPLTIRECSTGEPRIATKCDGATKLMDVVRNITPDMVVVSKVY